MTTFRRGLETVLVQGLVAGFVLVATGCPGTLENKEDFLGQGGAVATGSTTTGQGGGGTPADDPCDGLITERCAVPGCHVPERTPPDLSYEGRVERIRDVDAPICGGKLVDTANPEASLMYTKCIEGESTCGNQMPLTGAKLDEEDLACLLAWIETL